MMISVSFFYGPMVYFKSLFEKDKIMISTLYMVATLASLSTIFTGAGYLWSIGLVIIQGTSLFYFVMQVVRGGDNAQAGLKSFV